MGNTATVRPDGAPSITPPIITSQTPPPAPNAAPAAATPTWAMQRQAVATGDSIQKTPPPVPMVVDKPKVAGRFIATEKAPWAARFIKRPAVALLSAVASVVSRRWVAEVQVKAPDWVRALKPNQPMSWAIVHQTSLDFLYMFALQARLPFIPDVMIASRKYGDPENLKSKSWRVRFGEHVARTVMSAISFCVYFLNRPNMGDGKGNPRAEARMAAENAKVLNGIHARFRFGAHAAAFPEGTTMNSGAVGFAKSGTFGTTIMPNADGSVSYVPIGVVGNTLDLLAGPGKKSLAFINVGEQLSYEPVEPRAGESADEYNKRNGNAWSKRVGDAMVRAITVTPSQIVGVYLLAKAQRGEARVTFAELRQEIARQASAYAALGVHMDDKLLTPEGQVARLQDLWTNLQRTGYIRRDGDGGHVIDAERVTHESIDTSYDERKPQRFRRYRRDNPLRWCANHLFQVARSNPQIAKVIG